MRPDSPLTPTLAHEGGGGARGAEGPLSSPSWGKAGGAEPGLSATARPRDEADLAAVLREGRARGLPVGGGTRLRPGEARGIDTRGLTGVTLYEPAALTLVARAGTPLTEIETLLAGEGQMLAFEPPARPGSTIGGVIGANASGARRVLAGAARDALIGVRFVTGEGQVVANGGRVMKNVTGYDLVKLMAGSRGRLGVLTEVALKTAPRPPAAVTLALANLSAPAAIPAMTAALTRPFDVSGAAWLPSGLTCLRLEGLPGSVALRAEALTRVLAPFGPVERLQPDPDADPWAMLEGFGGDLPAGSALWRILCRPSEAAAILTRLDPGPVAVDWGGALILAEVPADWTPEALPAGARATRLAGGPPARHPAPDPVTARLEAGLRDRFDPRGAFA